jgi:hypothetical protein
LRFPGGRAAAGHTGGVPIPHQAPCVVGATNVLTLTVRRGVAAVVDATVTLTVRDSLANVVVAEVAVAHDASSPGTYPYVAPADAFPVAGTYEAFWEITAPDAAAPGGTASRPAKQLFAVADP